MASFEADQPGPSRNDALVHYQRWLRALPAGRGPHTQAAEARFEASLGLLHETVLRHLGSGEMPIDLRAHGTVLNTMPGADASALLWKISGGGPGRAWVLWPPGFLSAWRGNHRLLAWCGQAQGEEDEQESASEPSDTDDSTASTDDDSDTDRALFRARDQPGRLDMLLTYFCDQWHEGHEDFLADHHRVTNSQWLDVQEVLGQIRRFGGREALVVDLSVQWPAALLLSLHELFNTLRNEIAQRKLGVSDLRWRMADPVVPEELRAVEVYLDRCRFKVALEGLERRFRAWLSGQKHALPQWMKARNASLAQIQAACKALLAAEQQMLDALDKMQDGQGAWADLSAYADATWCQALRQHWPKWVSTQAASQKFGCLAIKWS